MSCPILRDISTPVDLGRLHAHGCQTLRRVVPTALIEEPGMPERNRLEGKLRHTPLDHHLEPRGVPQGEACMDSTDFRNFTMRHSRRLGRFNVTSTIRIDLDPTLQPVDSSYR